jgi:hypothetical protein
MYIQYRQGFFHSKLCTADYALVTSSLHYKDYPSSCLLFKTQLNSIGLTVPHRKNITSPLRAQQVNAI